jgi:hypothetical protein
MTTTKRTRSPMKNPSKSQYKAALEHYQAELEKLIAADDDVRVSQLRQVVLDQPSLSVSTASVEAESDSDEVSGSVSEETGEAAE